MLYGFFWLINLCKYRDFNIAYQNIPFERVLYGLGIRYVGETVAKKLAKHFENIDNILNSDFDELISVDEIGEKIANSIIEFSQNSENIEIINSLKSHNIQFLSLIHI